MLKTLSLSALCCLILAQANAQTLTMPNRIAKTYNNGTRQMNGKPGKNWWQNHGRYNIAVTVAPPEKKVSGVEQITYINNSPDKLDSLNFKLIVNVHRNERSRRNTPAQANPALGVTVDDFKINGAKANWDNNAATTTNYMVALPKALMPHDSVKLDISWHFDIANGRGRDGAIDSTTYYLAYFYPRVSVYDDYQGWDTQPHTGSLEFYNDFNDYKLSVTVPKNFLVWSTGTLTNANQVLQPVYAQRLQQSFTNDSTIHIVTAQDLAAKNITAQNPANTWTWTAHNVSDMAVAISDHYVWDGASVVVDDATKRRVSAQAAFDDASADFHHSVQFSRYSLRWFSQNWPGVPYPYEKSTAIQGFADMEYPMMINDSKEKDLSFAELVQDHEQAHTYMPFYMGINESRYAFMDEGWATTFEYLIGITEKGKKGADEFYKSFRVNRWIHLPHVNENPVITPSNEVTFDPGDNSYGKPSLSYLALKDYLGDALFKKALHTYMDNWHGKHPLPWDYFNSMKTGSGKNLDWFFYNWFFTKSYIDLDLISAERNGKGYTLNIKNVGGFAIPFDVVINYADGTTETLHQTPAVWERNQKDISLKINTKAEAKSIVLDGGIFMDATPADNQWPAAK